MSTSLGYILCTICLQQAGFFFLEYLGKSTYGQFRYLGYLLSTLGLGILVFLIPNLIIFFIAFEAMLIPLFGIILFWGENPKRLEAAYRLVYYTVLFSLPGLFSVVVLYLENGTLDFTLLQNNLIAGFVGHLELIWSMLFLSFLAKAALPPFHLWLVEAHVESPTMGSVVLSGVVLKVAFYGILCILLPIFQEVYLGVTYIVEGYSFLVLSYSVLVLFSQSDLKKIIAYFSVIHMGLMFVGIFSGTNTGVQGAYFLGIVHSFVSPALFLCVGYLYNRNQTKDIAILSQFANYMPIFAIIVFGLFLVEAAFPGTPNFIGELLIFIGTYCTHQLGFLALMPYFLLIGMFIFKTYTSVFFDEPNVLLVKYADLNFDEFLQLMLFIAYLCILAKFPQFLLESGTLFGIGFGLFSY
jgi:NADH-quinone oxidoreductase subunit M